MTEHRFLLLFVLHAILLIALLFSDQIRIYAQTPGEKMAAKYFRIQTERIASRALADVHTLADWQARRETYRGQLLEMLGLSPMPPRGDLKATITGKLETEKFTVEKIHFQSLPGLYVTGNLYIPKSLTGPAPTVLYVCGHSQTIKDGIAYGTKFGYHHHPAWLAEHGYVALILDTLEMGEIQGEHHGTHRRGMWWWPTRGYTPAGVEAWNAVRALDYLETRPEVDRQRIGVTGRSGGGAYSWFLAAIDDRPSVVIPVAGVTDMRNHVVDGCIEGHCDCMFQNNTYAWDFSILASLVAPRPLLLANSDKDRIFPLDGVQRVHRDVKRIYKLYNAEDKLGLLITEGPHEDTQDLQVPAFRWFNRWLKKDRGILAEPALKRFTAEQLRVFNSLPADQINTRIHESFVPAAPVPAVPQTREAWQAISESWRTVLREKVFNNWPAEPPPPAAHTISDEIRGGLRMVRMEFSPDEAYLLPLVLLLPEKSKPVRLIVNVLEEERALPGLDSDPLISRALEQGSALAFVYPRGIGPTAWAKEKDTHIRRRFLLLGQSLETMQVWDIRIALEMLRRQMDVGSLPVSLKASNTMGVAAFLASFYESSIETLELARLPETLAGGPSYPNALRYFDLPQLLPLSQARMIRLTGASPAAWEWSVTTAKLQGKRIVIQP